MTNLHCSICNLQSTFPAINNGQFYHVRAVTRRNEQQANAKSAKPTPKQTLHNDQFALFNLQFAIHLSSHQPWPIQSCPRHHSPQQTASQCQARQAHAQVNVTQ
jgi:hypothetical protein